jgi:hypothetical protein
VAQAEEAALVARAHAAGVGIYPVSPLYAASMGRAGGRTASAW